MYSLLLRSLSIETTHPVLPKLSAPVLTTTPHCGEAFVSSRLVSPFHFPQPYPSSFSRSPFQRLLEAVM